MNVIFTDDGFQEYTEWQARDRKTLKRINQLIKSIQRDGFLEGIGKPEQLKGRKECSRRIDSANRLVYSSDENRNIVIFSCKGHYED